MGLEVCIKYGISVRKGINALVLFDTFTVLIYQVIYNTYLINYSVQTVQIIL